MKIVKTTLLFVLFCLISTKYVSAQTTPTPTPDTDFVDPRFLLEVNPLTIMGNNNPIEDVVNGASNILIFSSPSAFLNALLIFLFPLAGVILFIMIVWGGFEMLAGGYNDDKALESGKQRITAAVIGFVLLFCSYWIAQVVQYIFGVNILG